jgi:ABC-2 family transporter protein
MTGLVRSEWLKVRSTRMWWGLVGGALAFVALNVVAQAFVPATEGVPGLKDPDGVRSVWASAGQVTLFALVLGIIGMTAEFRHRTVSATFLATPRRGRVLAAKMVAHAGLGLVLGLAACALTALLAIPLLAARGAISIPTSTILQVLAGATLASVLYAVIGVAVGALVTNQIAAILGAIVWVILVESLIVAFLPAVGKWLPGGAASAVLQANSPNGSLLDAWAGALLLLGYAVVFAAVAARTTLRRDVS